MSLFPAVWNFHTANLFRCVYPPFKLRPLLTYNLALPYILRSAFSMLHIFYAPHYILFSALYSFYFKFYTSLLWLYII